MTHNIKIRRALLSVSNKEGLVPLAQSLAAAGVELISTGGTAKVLRENQLTVKDLSEHTGFPEMLGGRVKTLHPKIHGGLLYLRGDADHEKTVQQHGILPIDLVVVNLYPFEETVARPDVTVAEAIENIDIGGPSMLRSAAKNYQAVTVVVDPDDYTEVAEQIRQSGGTTLELRQRLACKVFARTAAYDAAIATFLTGKLVATSAPAPEPGLPEELHVQVRRAQPLRYGENPHQKAALYGTFGDSYKQLHGRELSFNNLIDLTAAAHLIQEFAQDGPTLAILKHTNPCGVGQGESLREAWDKAFATDRQSPFGGIIAVNRELDLPCAEAIAEIFSEIIVAPNFHPDALARLQKKKNLRLMRYQPRSESPGDWEVRGVGDGLYLAQDRDMRTVAATELTFPTRRRPTDTELQAMLFGWRVVKHVKSNAIVYTAPDRTLGVRAGQMSRVDASRLAVWKAGQAGLSLKGSVICSDAFFPFPDALTAAAEAGATAAIQPGGSKGDPAVITAADEHDLAMAFTGVRHFRH